MCWHCCARSALRSACSGWQGGFRAGAASSAAQYLLKDHGGRLALYRPGETQPLEIYEIYTHLLPRQERGKPGGQFPSKARNSSTACWKISAPEARLLFAGQPLHCLCLPPGWVVNLGRNFNINGGESRGTFDPPSTPPGCCKKTPHPARIIAKARPDPQKVAIMSGSTIGEVKNMLELFFAGKRHPAGFYEGGYALFYENLVFDDGSLAAFGPDVIYIHTSQRNLKLWPELHRRRSAGAGKVGSRGFRPSLNRAAKAALGFGYSVILNNFDLPLLAGHGQRGRQRFAGGPRALVRRLNEKLAALAQPTPNLYLNDLCYLQAQHGMERFSDPTAWYAYKYAVSLECVPTLPKAWRTS